MGVEQKFTEGRTQEEWMRHLYQQSQAAIPELPSFEDFRAQGMFKNETRQAITLPITISAPIRLLTH